MPTFWFKLENHHQDNSLLLKQRQEFLREVTRFYLPWFVNCVNAPMYFYAICGLPRSVLHNILDESEWSWDLITFSRVLQTCRVSFFFFLKYLFQVSVFLNRKFLFFFLFFCSCLLRAVVVKRESNHQTSNLLSRISLMIPRLRKKKTAAY